MTRKLPVLLSILFICLWLFSIIIGCSGGDSGGGDSGGSPIPSPSVSPSAGWVVNVTGINTTLNNSSFISEIIGWVVGDNGVILKTLDNGTNWITQNSGSTNNLYGIHFINSNEGIAVGEEGKIIRTINGGTNWDENVSITPQTGNTLRAVEFEGNIGWIVGDGGVIYKSTDKGVTWTALSSGVSSDLLDLSFINSQTGWICGAGGLILHTSDGGETWTQQVSGVSANLHGISFVNSISGWSAGDSGTIISTNDGGINWRSEVSGVTTNLKDVFFVDVNYGWAVGDNGLILSKGRGTSGLWITGSYSRADWYQQTSHTTSNLIKLIFINRNIGYIVGENGLILITSNGGNDPNTPTDTPTTTPTDTPTTTPTDTPTDTPIPPPNPQKKAWQGAVPVDGMGVENQPVSDNKKVRTSKIKLKVVEAYERNVDITAFPNNTAIGVFSFNQGLNENKGFGDAIYANRFVDSEWGEPVKISGDFILPKFTGKDGISDCSLPRIAGNASGKAMAVWVQSDGSNYRIVANHWNGSEWEGPRIIDAAEERAESAYGDAATPEIAYSDDGTAMAVFTQKSGDIYYAYANRWNGSAWTGATIIHSGWDSMIKDTPTPSPSIEPTPLDAGNPQVVMTNNGLAAAVFTKQNGSRDMVCVNATDGQNWGSAMVVDDKAGGDSSLPQITVDKNLRVNVVFIQNIGGVNGTYSTYHNGTSWSTPALISSANGTESATPHLAVSYSGQNLAVFREMIDFLRRGYSNFAIGGNYQTYTTFDDPTKGETTYPRVAFDKYTSEALTVFSQDSGGEDAREGRQALIYANSWNGSSWGTPEKINFGDLGVDADIAWGNGQAFVIMRERINFEQDRVFANWYK